MLPAGYRRQLAVLFCALSLVWLLAFVVGLPSVAASPAPSAVATVWQSAPDQAEPILLQAQSERSSPQLFLHPKQQPLYVLIAEPVLLLLRLLALLLPVVLVLAWFIRAGPRRSFRLGLWRDANLCCKSQLYH
jgi:hypothetical protein